MTKHEARELVAKYGSVTAIHCGDCLAVLGGMADDSIDAVVTDPPYGLSFMGKKWDYDIPCVDIWRECLRVLKPGGHLLSFAGTRTQHRMACAIEDAGFEIRDMIAWVYGQGFPKSHNIACKCGGGTVSYSHEKKVSRKPKAERQVHPVRNADVSSPLGSGEGRGQVLQSGLSEPGTSIERSVPIEGAEGRAKPSMEGRSDVLAEARELQADQVRSVPCGVSADGAEGRLCDGTPADNGAPVGAMPVTDGSGPSSEPRPAGQPDGESGTIRGQSGAQARRICQKCGGVIGFDGWGTALKPAMEPITVARKPLVGTVAANVLAHGTGALNIDGCRVGAGEGRPLLVLDAKDTQNNAYAGRMDGTLAGGSKAAGETTLGRWPANLVHDGSDEVLGLFPHTKSGTGAIRKSAPGQFGLGGDGKPNIEYGDSGSAARFFYAAKASKRDRDEGLDGFEASQTTFAAGTGLRNNGDGTPRNQTPSNKNFHPTVKPTDLMRYLCRLVTPPGGTVLDPFMGSGSTGKAAVLEGFSFIGIEREAEYVEIAKARIENAKKKYPLGV